MSLPPSLAAKPNIPFEEQTLEQLKLEHAYWAEQIANANGWGAGVGAAQEFMETCAAWIKRHGKQ